MTLESIDLHTSIQTGRFGEKPLVIGLTHKVLDAASVLRNEKIIGDTPHGLKPDGFLGYA